MLLLGDIFWYCGPAETDKKNDCKDEGAKNNYWKREDGKYFTDFAIRWTVGEERTTASYVTL